MILNKDIMRLLICMIAFLFFLLSCNVNNEKNVVECLPVKELSKLEKFLLSPSDSVIVHCDLSNDSIADFPDLSGYTIKSLDLSHNLLDTIRIDYLPQGLERLNLSHNFYCGFLVIEERTMPFLQELDMSYNALNWINIGEPFYRIILSYNDLKNVDINHKNIQYLDISFNSDISENVCFNASLIDTIVREGVANGKPFIVPHAPPLPHPTFISE